MVKSVAMIGLKNQVTRFDRTLQKHQQAQVQWQQQENKLNNITGRNVKSSSSLMRV